MRRVAVLTMALVLPLSLISVGARAQSDSTRHLDLPALAQVDADALTKALEAGDISEAEYALHRARALFTLGEVRAEFGDVERQDPHAATWILRDLAIRARSLSGEELAEAIKILARPDDSGDPDDGWSSNATKAPPVCGQEICVHYVIDTSDRSDAAWASLVLATFEHVWNTELGMGFRAPKSDGTKGGDDKLDVYIDNLDVDGFYGYCTTDARTAPPYDVPAYCAVDNDYARIAALDGGQPEAYLQATAAHEFLHAVQFGYDVLEDSWIDEATATWMEEHVYDGINDNRQYQNNSMTRPNVPADSWDEGFGVPPGFHYGQWVWFQYLTQVHGPSFVKELYDRLDAAAGASDDYSLEGLTNLLAAKGTTFGASFADFAAKNAEPSAFYAEANEAPSYYKRSPRSATHAVGSTASGGVSGVDHLTSRYVSFTPANAGSQPLTVAVNMSDTSTGSQAVLVTIPTSGTVQYAPVALDSTGYGFATVNDFASMREVVLVMANASTRYSNCAKDRNPFNVCNGVALDDNQSYSYAAALGTTAPDPGAGDSTGPVVSNLTATPKTFRANGRNFTEVTFNLDENGRVTVTIKNSSGRKVLGFADTIDDAPGMYGFRWFGQNSRNKLLPAGKYKVKVSAVDPSGNRGTADSTTVTVKR